jgi:hypothetical protein
MAHPEVGKPSRLAERARSRVLGSHLDEKSANRRSGGLPYRLISTILGMHLTQVATTGSLVAERKATRERCNQFEARFSTEESCREYLFQLRRPEFFSLAQQAVDHRPNDLRPDRQALQVGHSKSQSVGAT